ncbi:hypothetical protein H4R33_003464 [Dimargaris cristalligena]|uniref:Superoxide dismutase copper/zinc binding domain-containing protein n=1 Tax=Dimargaris cristalligena TaxID=215637 RepID=A0A4P9ZST8_9FUNG|nr:hypothetical protein H4R33_003464 [Dimargaris cristalligena]RKP36634.1 hypothetical protein BJ085DRAFT_29930 [Dimargaris cristalligena]|eukprot:RKP36634.1 hypothetical protein BJ085DRAFT_29930 [Dimargaris cristalligena]
MWAILFQIGSLLLAPSLARSVINSEAIATFDSTSTVQGTVRFQASDTSVNILTSITGLSHLNKYSWDLYSPGLTTSALNPQKSRRSQLSCPIDDLLDPFHATRSPTYTCYSKATSKACALGQLTGKFGCWKGPAAGKTLSRTYSDDTISLSGNQSIVGSYLVVRNALNHIIGCALVVLDSDE